MALIYIAINYALGRLAQFIQRRQARSGRVSRAAAATAAGPGPAQVSGGAVNAGA